MLMFFINVFSLILSLFILYIIFTFICTLFVDKNKLYTKRSVFYRFLLNSWTSIGIRLCKIEVDIEGLENVPENTRFVMVGNHRSNYDPIIAWYILKKHDLIFISKKSNFKIPLFGKIIRKCCFMDIDRENPRNAAVTIQNSVNLINNNVGCIGVYPEGTRSKSLEILEFHNCVFKIAQRSKTPLVVLTLDGTQNIAKNTPFHKTIVKATINTIPYEEIENLPTNEIGDMVKKIFIYNLSEEKSSESGFCAQ